ncbi:MAG TPA: hypothetical protein VIV66_19660, partial [Pyrinomonadaceae bacterium]
MTTRSQQVLACCLCLILMCLLAASKQDILAQSSLVRSDVQPHPVNLDFEQGIVGQVPQGWTAPTRANYPAELTEEQPKSGKRSALLRSVSTGPAGGSEFGNLMQAIDAASLRGRRVRFRAAVRVESAQPVARAQLWLRVDRSANKMGFFDNMGDRPITSGEWQYYEIVGDVDQDAAVINFGMILLGKGKAWLDDVSFEDLGKLVVRAEPARPLTDRGLENIVAFTRLLGYVRHFHPSDEAVATNWDSFAIEGVSIAEGAKDAVDLAKKLEDIFRPVGPTIRVFATGEVARVPNVLTPPKDDPSLKIVSWQHRGFGQKAARDSVYASERVRKDAPGGRIPPGAPDPQKPFITSLGGGVSCLVPLALFADAQGTLPHSSPHVADTKDTLVKFSGNDRATRLADVALTWNILQHFYPYFDVARTDWPQALRAALTSAAQDPDELAFLNTLRRMVAQLHDGHGGVYHPSDSNGYTVPVLLGWVEGHLVITEVAAAGAEGLQPGDIIIKINGQPSGDVLAQSEELISA